VRIGVETRNRRRRRQCERFPSAAVDEPSLVAARELERRIAERAPGGPADQAPRRLAQLHEQLADGRTRQASVQDHGGAEELDRSATEDKQAEPDAGHGGARRQRSGARPTARMTRSALPTASYGEQLPPRHGRSPRLPRRRSRRDGQPIGDRDGRLGFLEHRLRATRCESTSAEVPGGRCPSAVNGSNSTATAWSTSNFA